MFTKSELERFGYYGHFKVGSQLLAPICFAEDASLLHWRYGENWIHAARSLSDCYRDFEIGTGIPIWMLEREWFSKWREDYLVCNVIVAYPKVMPKTLPLWMKDLFTHRVFARRITAIQTVRDARIMGVEGVSKIPMWGVK